MKIQTIALAATLAVAPFAANAATWIPDDAEGPYDLGTCGDTFYFGDIVSAGGAGSRTITFEACDIPSAGIAEASITTNIAGLFANLTAGWADGDSVMVTDGSGALLVPNIFELFTEFTVDTNPQDLTFTWTQSVKNASFDYNVNTAAVPVPAGILLLGTALAGLGFARRKA